jgi:hypothetical protein
MGLKDSFDTSIFCLDFIPEDCSFCQLVRIASRQILSYASQQRFPHAEPRSQKTPDFEIEQISHPG